MKRILKIFRPIAWLVLIAFSINTAVAEPVQASVLNLPEPGQMVSLSPSFAPPMIEGLKVYKDNPFKFDFIVSQGDGSPTQVKDEANKLVKYFLAALTIPEADMWVNLSPFEKDRIATKEFGITETGKELLAQDYLLKQVTSSIMYPEGKAGKEFWSKIYKEANKRFGTSTIPVSTFNKVWIVPDTAVVFENAADNTAVVKESKLKVMLEEDYLALNKSVKSVEVKTDTDKTKILSNELIRQIILPLLETEVNTGKNFASLRQVYHSLILAYWFKSKLKQSLISKGYVDRKITNGVDVDNKNVDQEIYQRYLKSYKKGVYNYIKEDIGPDNQMIPRKYFSGGFNAAMLANSMRMVSGPDEAMAIRSKWNGLKLLVCAGSIVLSFGAAENTLGAENKTAEPNLGKTPIVEVAIQKDKKQTHVQDVLDAVDHLIERSTGGKITDAGHQSALILIRAGAIVGEDGKTIAESDLTTLNGKEGKVKLGLDMGVVGGLRDKGGLTHAVKKLVDLAPTIAKTTSTTPTTATTPAPQTGAPVVAPGAILKAPTAPTSAPIAPTVNFTGRVAADIEAGISALKGVGSFYDQSLTEIAGHGGVKILDKDAEGVTSLNNNSHGGTYTVNIDNDTLRNVDLHSVKYTGSKHFIQRAIDNPNLHLEQLTIDSLGTAAVGAAGAPPGGNPPPGPPPPDQLTKGLNTASPPIAIPVAIPVARIIKVAPTVAIPTISQSTGLFNANSFVNNPGLINSGPNLQLNYLDPVTGFTGIPFVSHGLNQAVPAVLPQAPAPTTFNAPTNLPTNYPLNFNWSFTGGLNPLNTTFNMMLNVLPHSINPFVTGNFLPFMTVNPTPPATVNTTGVLAPIAQTPISTPMPTDQHLVNSFPALWQFIPNVQESSLIQHATDEANRLYASSLAKLHEGKAALEARFENMINNAPVVFTDHSGKPLDAKTAAEQLKKNQLRWEYKENTAKLNVLLKTDDTNKDGPAIIITEPTTNKIVRTYKNVDDFVKFLTGSPNSKQKYYRIPIDATDPLDIARALSHPITSPKEIRDAFDSETPVNIYFEGVDSNGNKVSGFINGSRKAVQQSWESALATYRDRILSKSILNILNITNRDQQVRTIRSAFPNARLSGDPTKLYVAVEVTSNKDGLTTGVERFLTADEINGGAFGGVGKLTVVKNGKAWALQYSVTGDLNWKSFTLVDPDVKGIASEDLGGNHIILGANEFRTQDMNGQVALYLNKRDELNAARWLASRKQKLVIEGAFVPANLFLVTDVPVEAIVLLAFDVLTHKNISKYDKAPTEKQVVSFFAKYRLGLKVGEDKVEDQWKTMNKDARDKLELETAKWMKSLQNDGEIRRTREYLEKKHGDNEADFLLGLLSQIASLAGGYTSDQTLGILLRQEIVGFSFTNGLTVNASGLAKLLVPNKTVTTTTTTTATKTTAINIAANSVNAKTGVATAVSNTNVPVKTTTTSTTSTTAVTKTNIVHTIFSKLGVGVGRINGNYVGEHQLRVTWNLVGVEIDLFNQIALYTNIEEIRANRQFAAIDITHGITFDHARGVTFEQMDAHFTHAGGIGLKPAGFIEIGERKVRLPVYYIAEPSVDGKTPPKLRAFIMTEAGIERNLQGVRHDMEAYGADLLTNGGAIVYSSYFADYNQAYPTHLYQSHDRTGQVWTNDAYTWDQMLMVERALISGDIVKAQEILGSFGFMHAELVKASPRHDFPGFPNSRNPITGSPKGDINDRGVGPNASVGLAILRYKQYMPQDTQFDPMLKDIVKWLLKIHTSGGLVEHPGSTTKAAEPNALAYLLFKKYNEEHSGFLALGVGPNAGRAADDILKWLKKSMLLQGPDGLLIRNAEGEEGSSLDANSRWLGIGPDLYTDALKMTPQAFENHLDKIYHTFYVKALGGMDLADPLHASVRPGKVRLMNPEATAEMARGFLESAEYFTRHNMPQAAARCKERANLLFSNLQKIRSNHGGRLPQFVAPFSLEGRNIPSGYGYYAAWGSSSIASIARVDIARYENPFRDAPIIAKGLLKLPRPKELSRDELLFGKVYPGKANYFKFQARLDGAVAGYSSDKLIGHPNLNGIEGGVLNSSGQYEYIKLKVPDAELYKHFGLEFSRYANGIRYMEALEGRGEFYDGGVVFSVKGPLAGQPIRDQDGYYVLNSAWVHKLLDHIDQLPDAEKLAIQYSNFANFKVTIDINGDGHPQEIAASIIFPAGKETAVKSRVKSTDQSKIVVYNSLGAPLYEVSNDRYTVFTYDDTSHLLSDTTVYDLPMGLKRNINDLQVNSPELADYLASLKKSFKATPFEKVTRGHTLSSIIPAPQAQDAPKEGDTISTTLVQKMGPEPASLYVNGIHPTPDEVVTPDSMTTFKLDPWGLPISAQTYFNLSPQPLNSLARLTNPVRGAWRSSDRVIGGIPYHTTMIHETNTGQKQIVVLDNAHDRFVLKYDLDGYTNSEGEHYSFGSMQIPHYDPNYLAGLYPNVTAKVNTNGRLTILGHTTINDLPGALTVRHEENLLKGRHASEITHDGTIDEDIEKFIPNGLSTLPSVTTIQFNSDHTQTHSETSITGSTGVAQVKFTGTGIFNPQTNNWNLTRQLWHQYPQIPLGVPQVYLQTPYGRTIEFTGQFVDGQIRLDVLHFTNGEQEVAGTGWRMNPKTNRYEHEFNYGSPYVYNDGELTRGVTEVLNGGKHHEETLAVEGPIKQLKEDPRLVHDGAAPVGMGQRVTNYDFQNSLDPLIPSSTTDIQLSFTNGTPSRTIPHYIVTWPGEYRGGLLTNNFLNHSGVGWQATSDMFRRGRITQAAVYRMNPQGRLSPVNETVNSYPPDGTYTPTENPTGFKMSVYGKDGVARPETKGTIATANGVQTIDTSYLRSGKHTVTLQNPYAEVTSSTLYLTDETGKPIGLSIETPTDYDVFGHPQHSVTTIHDNSKNRDVKWGGFTNVTPLEFHVNTGHIVTSPFGLTIEHPQDLIFNGLGHLILETTHLYRNPTDPIKNVDQVIEHMGHDNYGKPTTTEVVRRTNGQDTPVASIKDVTTDADFAKDDTRSTKFDPTKGVLSEELYDAFGRLKSDKVNERKSDKDPWETVHQGHYFGYDAFGFAGKTTTDVWYEGKFTPFISTAVDPSNDPIVDGYRLIIENHLKLDGGAVGHVEKVKLKLWGEEFERNTVLGNGSHAMVSENASGANNAMKVKPIIVSVVVLAHVIAAAYFVAKDFNGSTSNQPSKEAGQTSQVEVSKEKTVVQTYRLSGDDPSIVYSDLPAGQGLNMKLPNGSTDLSGNDFVTFFARSGDPNAYGDIQITFTDQSGKQVTVMTIADKDKYFNNLGEKHDGDITKTGTLPFWFPSSLNGVATPDSKSAARIAGVVVDYESLHGGQINPFAVSVQQLLDMGLDIAHMKTVTASRVGQASSPVEISSLRTHGSGVKKEKRDLGDFGGELQNSIVDPGFNFNNTNGTLTVRRGYNFLDREGHEKKGHVSTTTYKNGLRIGVTFDRYEDSRLTITTPVTQYLDFDPRLGVDRGVVNNYSSYPFKFTADALGGRLNGYDYEFRLPNGVSATGMTKKDRDFVNSTVNVFGGEIIVPQEVGKGTLLTFLRDVTRNDTYTIALRRWFHYDPNYNPSPKDEAVFQDIRDKLGELKNHPVSQYANNKPIWDGPKPLQSGDLHQVTTQEFIASVQALRNNKSRWIETNPNTVNKNIVDMNKLGKILATLLSTNDPEAFKIADEILMGDGKPDTFSIWNNTDGGRLSVTNFYDVENQSPLRQDPELKNETVALITADSQISIANAYLLLWQKTGNPHALSAAINLVNGENGLLTKFHPVDAQGNIIGGISEFPFEQDYKVVGIKFQGRGAIYPTETNSNAYMFLRSLQNASKDAKEFTPEFHGELTKAIQSLEKFFDEQLMPRVKRDGIVPSGKYTHKDWIKGDSKIAEILDSNPRAWVAFIEAARLMEKIDDATARQLLDNMAKAHGVSIDGQTGLDLSIDPGVSYISPEATIVTLGAAKLVGYENAADFLESAIAGYPQGADGLFPVVVGLSTQRVDPKKGVKSGDVTANWYPRADGQGWAYSPTTMADLMLAQEGGHSVYNLPAKALTPQQELVKAGRNFQAPNPRSLFAPIIAISLLGVFLLKSFIKRFLGIFTKPLLLNEKNAVPVEQQDADRAHERIRRLFGDDPNAAMASKRSIVIRSADGRSLDFMASGGIRALLYLSEMIKRKDPTGTIIDDNKLDEFINIWSRIVYDELKNSNKYWGEKTNWFTYLRRILGIRFQGGFFSRILGISEETIESDIATDPRYKPVMLIDKYIWKFVIPLRDLVAEGGDVKDLKDVTKLKAVVNKVLNILIGLEEDGTKSVKVTDLKENTKARYRVWALQKKKETRNPLFVLATAKNLPAVYLILVAASFIRSEITRLQPLANYISHNKLMTFISNNLNGFSFCSGPVLGAFSLLAVYMIPGKNVIAKAFRAVLGLTGLVMAGNWLLGLVGGKTLNLLFSDSLSISTGSHLIVNTFLNQVTQNASLFFAGAATLMMSFVFDFIHVGEKYMRHVRRVLGGFGAGVMVYCLASGLHVPDAASGLVMYSTILALGGEAIIRARSSHSVFGTATRYHLAPQYRFEGTRPFLFNFLVKATYFVTAIITTLSIFPVVELKLAVGDMDTWRQLAGGYGQFVAGLILSHYSVFLLYYSVIAGTAHAIPAYIYRHFTGFFRSLKGGSNAMTANPTNQDAIIPSKIEAITYEDIMPPPPAILAGHWKTVLKLYPDEVDYLFSFISHQLSPNPDSPVITMDQLRNPKFVEKLLEDLAKYESDPTHLCPDTHLPLELVLRPVEEIPETVHDYQLLRAAFHIRHSISLRTGATDKNGKITTQETFIFLASLATQLGSRGRNVQLFSISNNINSNFEGGGQVETAEERIKERMVLLWDILTGQDPKQKFRSRVIINETPAGNKIGSQTHAYLWARPNTIGSFMLDRSAGSPNADEIEKALNSFAPDPENPNHVVIGVIATRSSINTSPEDGYGTQVQRIAEGAHGLVGVETDAIISPVSGASFGWTNSYLSDFVGDILSFFTLGQRRPPQSKKNDDISEDSSETAGEMDTKQSQGKVAITKVANIKGKKMRERKIRDLWNSLIRWASGKIQMLWGLDYQESFILGNQPDAIKEFRLTLAGIFSLAPLGALYAVGLAFSIITGATYYVGINLAFYMFGVLQGLVSTIILSLWTEIQNRGFISGQGRWLAAQFANLINFTATQLWINVSGATRGYLIGVGTKFVLMQASSEGEESPAVNLGFIRDPKNPDKFIIDKNAKKDQTYAFTTVMGAFGVTSLLYALSRLDLLNVTMLSMTYVMMTAALLVAFILNDRIGTSPKSWWAEPGTKALTHLATIVTVFGVVAGINVPGLAWLIVPSVSAFAIMGYFGTVLVHRNLRKKLEPLEAELNKEGNSEIKIRELNNKVDHINKTRRILSTVSRTAWTSLILQLPFVIVKIAGLMYAEIGTRVVHVPFSGFMHGVLNILTLGTISIGIAKLNDFRQRGKSKTEYDPEMNSSWSAVKARLPSSVNATLQDKMDQYRVEITAGHWLEAKSVRAEFYDILKRGSAAMKTEATAAPADDLTNDGIPADSGTVAEESNTIRWNPDNNVYAKAMQLLDSPMIRLTLGANTGEATPASNNNNVVNKVTSMPSSVQGTITLNNAPNVSGNLSAGTASNMSANTPVSATGNVGAAKDTLVNGGIDLSKTLVHVDASGGGIQLNFDDPAMLRLLLNAEGITPIIYNINVMTPKMVDHFVGLG